MDSTKAATRLIWLVIIWLKSKKDYYISLDCLLDCRRRHMSADSSSRKKILSLCQLYHPVITPFSESFYCVCGILSIRCGTFRTHLLYLTKPLAPSHQYKIAIVFVHISIDAPSLKGN